MYKYCYSNEGAFYAKGLYLCIAHYKNVRGLGKSIVVFRLFEKLR